MGGIGQPDEEEKPPFHEIVKLTISKPKNRNNTLFNLDCNKIIEAK